MFWPVATDSMLKSFAPMGTKEALKITNLITMAICIPLMGVSCFLIRRTEVARHLKDANDFEERPPPVFSLKFLHTATHCLTKQQLALSLALFFVWMGAIIPYGYIPLWAEVYIGGSWPAYLLTISYATSFVGRLLLTWLSDKVGHFNVFIVTTFLTGALIMV